MIENLASAIKETGIQSIKEVKEVTSIETSLETINIVEDCSLEALEAENQILENQYSESSFKSINEMNISAEEKEIYDQAGLKKETINNREVLIQPNIDYHSPLGIPGIETQTNLDRMNAGYAPLDENGNAYQLHHIGQENNSPLAELTNEQHQANGNYSILHTKEGPSEINRKEFNEQRAEHWKERAAQIEF
ncbi:HNH/ENDO VII family nuclease [uncultured Tenacibaculum sp.]|uniref:HNH/ENDO VII family nuclease n=1 Tax=uncultured Tenacibaculum sp. TaxID=174713 RepID=UPI00262284F5|nr:HNH/ENDO VII family nuclease [uncultured Tenacibaculum sp.]